jgi:hypothetical protein
VTPDSTTSEPEREAAHRLFGEGEHDARNDFAAIGAVETGRERVRLHPPEDGVEHDHQQQKDNRP